MLRQIVYTSLVTCPLTPAAIELLLLKARRANALSDVTGLLIHSNSRFLQILEGPNDAVVALYAKIEEDKRHHSLRLIDDRHTAFRAYPDWQMAFEDNPNPNTNDVVLKSLIRMMNHIPIDKVA
ncbi:BLUF domain-containing protein [Sphingomicrobium astaxanthinifaciens]|uniref:BLUF domain-containing protein n=1 Tax=Sphingomicrobium astaxanthinifaciens TaxID=1227949 RepID=UPI001FCC3438|nr:BLUF domain-containing protein [Sphingomicrobium astaxanthinifaciens]MCJ7420427.1 BLUF domain-containing protein [Sphingomicrobium astaxanthinifaciens]